MDYHLHHLGQNVGVFPLEELRRRRAAGELSGNDLVWRAGMRSWVTLDSVLQGTNDALTGAKPTPLGPTPDSKKSNRALMSVVAIGAVLLAVAAIVAGLAFMRFAREVKRTLVSTKNTVSAEELAGRPIVTDASTLTYDSVRKQNREFRVRQYVESYRQNGRHTAAWDSDALQLFDSWLAANFGGATNLPAPEVLSDKLASMADCDDPIVLTIAAVNGIELHETVRRLERAVAAFEKSPYRAYPKFYASVSLAAAVTDTSRIASLDKLALEQFEKAFTDGSLQPGDEQQIAEILHNGWANGFYKRNDAAVLQIVNRHKDYRWLALTIEGENEISDAWKARGGGWANTVSEKGWQGFRLHLGKARQALTQAWQMYPRRPLAPARMITVAMGQGGAEEMRIWFDRATIAQIDYAPAWKFFRFGLRPRWHGSEEALLALGMQAVETKRFDTDVPRILFDCIESVESDLSLKSGQHIYGRADVWPYLQRMYEGYIVEPTQAECRDGWRSTYAVVAFLAANYAVSRHQLEALNWQPARNNLTGWGIDLSLMPLKVAALTSKSAAQVESAEAKFNEQDVPAAITLFTELSSAADADERTREFARCRLAALQQEAALAKGEAVTLIPASENDPNWVFADCKVRCMPDSSIEVQSGPRGHSMYCRTRVGPEFEVTGEFEVVRSSTSSFQGGIVVGLPDSLSSHWYGFRIKRNTVEGDVASFSHSWTLGQQVLGKTALNDDRNSFQLRVEGDKVDVWVNGVQVLQRASPSKTLSLDRNCLLGLGAYNDMNDTVLRYRNVKVRRLSDGDARRAGK